MKPQEPPPGRAGTPASQSPRAAGPVAPAYAEALREHFPSREELLREAAAQSERQRARRRAASTALLPAVVLAVGAGLWWADPALRTETLQTATGQQARWDMRDGSRIQLNTGTTVLARTHLRSRRFVLEAGEAAFVATHNWRPFIVEAGDTRVRDIGTAFNVRREGPGAHVLVTEGAVEVTRAGAHAVLQAGQSVQPAADGGDGLAPVQQHATPQAATAWQQGRIAFDGTPLAEAMRDIQRYRIAPIALADDPAIAGLRISGDYDVQGIEALIDALPQVLPVSVARAPDGSVRITGQR